LQLEAGTHRTWKPGAAWSDGAPRFGTVAALIGMSRAADDRGGWEGQAPMAKQADTQADGDAQAASADERMKTSRKVRCRFAHGSDSGPRFTDDIARQLRTRLRLGVLILLAGFVLHLLRNVWQGPALDHRLLWIVIISSEIVVLAAVSALLWGRRPLSLKTLRVVELAVFGVIAAFFAWLQLDAFYDGALRRAIAPGGEDQVFWQVGKASAFRWFLLIVIYGTFVPNTGRRCAAVVGVLAVIPLALQLAGGLMGDAPRPYLLSFLPDMAILMATAVAVAVFGSHKFQELQRQAHEAQRLGQYRLKKVLGFGGMGTVYLAEHVLLRRPCAVKLIRADQAGDPRTLSRFEREVRATATLTHPNTVEIYDYGHADDGTFYYVMEYLPGMNLEDLVDQYGPMPAERAVHLMRQVCQALREAHGIGLIHRDVKPGNIFASERGKVYDVAKLLDFGLVKSACLDDQKPGLTREGALTGSPAFVSPEQAVGRPQIDARSDIYNVGAVAYFLIAGQMLFDRTSALQMLHAHAYEPPVPNERFREAAPADLQAVILRCLEKDPDRRYQDAASLDSALAACAGAGAWTPERAEAWWRQYSEGAAPPTGDPAPTAPEGASSWVSAAGRIQ
jgi:serine/threonine-protein kinase